MKTAFQNLEKFNRHDDLNKELKKSFKEALKNPDFKKLVDQIPLSEEELMKYTSSLEESALEHKNASMTDSIVNCKNKVKGYIYTPRVVDGKLEFHYVPAPYQKKILEESKHLNQIYFFDIPDAIRHANMKDIFIDDARRAGVIKWITNFIKNYEKNPKQKGLYLHGSFGSGKTYLISAMFNELAKKGVKSAILYWPEFLRDLKGSFNQDFNERIQYIKKVPLLLLDDIGAENNTEWGRDEILGTILQYRMQESLPTFFTSNLDKKLLKEHLSITKDNVSLVKAQRIIERINQLTEEEELVSKNLRM